MSSYKKCVRSFVIQTQETELSKTFLSTKNSWKTVDCSKHLMLCQRVQFITSIQLQQTPSWLIFLSLRSPKFSLTVENVYSKFSPSGTLTKKISSQEAMYNVLRCESSIKIPMNSTSI